ncbi:MAG: BatA domain-containing protein [Pirellulaceae bacterium]
MPVTILGPLPFAWLNWNSPWMLLWVIAAIVPWLIARRRRKSETTMPWPAMEFLREAMAQATTVRRAPSNWLRWLRSLALLALGLAVAQPLWQPGPQPFIGSKASHPQCLLFWIDPSLSMGWTVDGVDRLELAKRWCRKKLQSLQPGQSAIWLGGAAARLSAPRPSLNPDDLLPLIEQMQVEDGTGESLATVLSRAAGAILNAKDSLPVGTAFELILLSDLESNSWIEQLPSLDPELLPAELKEVPRQIVSCRHPVDPQGHLAIDRLVVPDPVIAGEPCVLQAQGRWIGNPPPEGVAVRWLIDSFQRASQRVEAKEGGVSMEWTWVPSTAGRYEVAVQRESNSLPADQITAIQVEVLPPPSIDLLEGKDRAGRFVAAALESLTELEGNAATWKRGMLPGWQVDALGPSSSIWLCDVPLEAPGSRQAMEDCWQRGASLVVWCGPQTVSAAQGAKRMSELVPSWTQWGLPDWQWQGVVELELPFDRNSISPILDPMEYTSPLLAPFRDHPRSGLLDAPIQRHWRWRLEEGPNDSRSTSTPPWTIDLKTAAGDPMIVHHRFGRGIAYWIATAPAPALPDGQSGWNAWAAWPSFVPLIDSLANRLLEQRDKPLHGPLPMMLESPFVEAILPSHRLRDPEDQPLPIRWEKSSGGLWQATASAGQIAGRYQWDDPDPSYTKIWSLQRPMQELTMDTLPPDRLPKGWKEGDGTLPDSAVPIARPIFRWFLAVVLGLLLTESILLGIRKTAGNRPGSSTAQGLHGRFDRG